MTPTPKLRFVERTVPMHPFYKTMDAQGNLVQSVHTYRVLQQWWEDNSTDVYWVNGAPGEWRDIPLEKEE